MDKKCYCCSGDLKYRFTVNNYKLFKCRRCGSNFFFPRPDSQTLDKVYSKEYFTEEYYDDYQESGKHYMNIVFSELETRGYFERINNLLDIGCANGYFLSLVKNMGITVSGVEYSEHMKKIAKEEFGIDILIGDILNLEISEKFDLVTMLHVFEHTLDPAEVLAGVRDLLTESGKIIIEIPYIMGAGAIIKGKNWSQFSPPNHLNYVTRKGFKELCSKLDLKIERISTNINNTEQLIQRFPAVLRWLVSLNLKIFNLLGLGGNIRVVISRDAR